jgi:hypothetical protein
VPDNGLRIELGHPRRAHHDGGGPGGSRLPAVLDAGPGAVGTGPGHDPDSPGHLIDDDLEHPRPLAIIEPGHFAGHAERGHPVHAGRNEELDHAAQARFIDVAVLRERGRENRIHTLWFQNWSFL